MKAPVWFGTKIKLDIASDSPILVRPRHGADGNKLECGYMSIFEGYVSLFERNGAVEIRKVSSGGYDATEVADLITDMLELKRPVSKWSLWIDGIDVKQADTYSPTTMAKLFKNNTVELIAVRRKGRNGQFKAPVLKITSPNAAPKQAVNKARLGR